MKSDLEQEILTRFSLALSTHNHELLCEAFAVAVVAFVMEANADGEINGADVDNPSAYDWVRPR